MVSDGQADRRKKEFIPGPSRQSSAVVWEKIVRVKGGIGLVEEAPRKVTRDKRPKRRGEVPHRSGSNDQGLFPGDGESEM
jgi:hypothetical protein